MVGNGFSMVEDDYFKICLEQTTMKRGMKFYSFQDTRRIFYIH